MDGLKISQEQGMNEVSFLLKELTQLLPSIAGCGRPFDLIEGALRKTFIYNVPYLSLALVVRINFVFDFLQVSIGQGYSSRSAA